MKRVAHQITCNMNANKFEKISLCASNAHVVTLRLLKPDPHHFMLLSRSRFFAMVEPWPTPYNALIMLLYLNSNKHASLTQSRPLPNLGNLTTNEQYHTYIRKGAIARLYPMYITFEMFNTANRLNLPVHSPDKLVITFINTWCPRESIKQIKTLSK